MGHFPFQRAKPLKPNSDRMRMWSCFKETQLKTNSIPLTSLQNWHHWLFFFFYFGDVGVNEGYWKGQVLIAGGK